jgi:hypothetical protein
MMEIYLHSPIRLHNVVLNELRAGIAPAFTLPLSVGYVTTVSVARSYSVARMDGKRIMIWKGYERKRSWSNRDIFQTKGLRKTTKTSLRIVDVPIEIPTKHFPNMSSVLPLHRRVRYLKVYLKVQVIIIRLILVNEIFIGIPLFYNLYGIHPVVY